MATREELDAFYAQQLANAKPGVSPGYVPVDYDTSGAVRGGPSISGVSEAQAAIASPEQMALQAQYADATPADPAALVDPTALPTDVQVQEPSMEQMAALAQSTGAGAGVGNPYLAKAESAAREAVRLTGEAADKQAQVAQAKSKEAKDELAKAQADQAQAVAFQKERMLAMEKMDRDFEAKNAADEEQIRREHSIQVDPNRYWANKDAGQKAMSVIAAGLFGYLGKGMDYLKRLDNLVQEDIQLQERERANRISMAEKVQGAHRKNYESLRGAQKDSLEWSLRQEGRIWQNYKLVLESIDVRHAGPAAEAQKDVAMAHANEQLASKMVALSQIVSHEKTAADAAMMRMQMAQMKATAKPQGLKLPPIEQTKLTSGQEAIRLMNEMVGEAGTGKGYGGAVADSTKALFGGKSKESEATYILLSKKLIKAIAESALQAHEDEIFGGPLPEWSEWTTDTKRRLRRSANIAQRILTEQARALNQQGYAIDPEAYKVRDTVPAQSPADNEKIKKVN